MSRTKNPRPTAATVSRMLAAHGFTRSQRHATRVRGYATYSKGFRVQSLASGGVQVRYIDDHMHHEDRRRAFMDTARAVLEQKYAVWASDGGSALVVSQKDDFDE